MENILIIHHGWGIGGGLIAMARLAHQLQKEYDVKILCVFQSEAVAYLRDEGFNVDVVDHFFYRKFYSLFIHTAATYFSLQNSLKKIYALLMYLFSMYFFAPKVLKQHLVDIDIVYLNSLFISDWSRAAKKNSKKVLLHVREPLLTGLFSLRKQILRRTIDKFVDSIIAVSNDNAQRLDLLHKTTVVYDPVGDIDNCSSVPCNLPCDDDYVYFTYVGGEQRIKGFEQLVRSLDYLDKRVRIFFIGNYVFEERKSLSNCIRYLISPYFRRLRFLKMKLENSKNSLILGHINDVFTYYQLSRAIISPFSKPHASLPILEAFSIGKPVIASDVGGTTELVDDRVGVIYKNGDYEALATEMNKFVLKDTDAMNTFEVQALFRYNEIKKNSPSIVDIINHCK